MDKETKILEFIKKAKEIHKGENLDYSEVVYVNNRTPVKIIDHDLDENGEEYGEFWQTPSNHLKGQSHPLKRALKIKKKRSHSQEEVIERFKQVHKGENLDYSKVKYKNMHTKVCIIDHDLDENGEEYGEFWQEPSAHLKGCKHPKKCRNKSALKYYERSNIIDFIEKAKKVHGDKYDYSKVDYINAHTKVCIICPEHGEFWQTPNNHLQGKKCPMCSKELHKYLNLMDTKEWIYKAKELYGNKYDYSKVDYINAKNKVCIVCPKHGEFWQEANSHLMGHICPLCSNGMSKDENEIFEFIKEYIPSTIKRDRNILNGKELDIYVPSKRIAIEYHGLRWHTEFFAGKTKYYHINKLTQCIDNDIKLIQIFEDEYVTNKNVVLNKLLHILNIDLKLPKIGGRKCKICEINKDEAKGFLDAFHIQKYTPSTVYLGAYYNNKLIGVMTFLNEKNNQWNLTRFASDYNYICQGIGGKLFQYFVKKYNPNEVKSFADRRWTINEENNVYIQLGFKFDKYLSPEYRYYNPKVDRYKRFHKFAFRKQILHKRFNLPLSMSETEMIKELGYDRIWDCGLIKYIWKK